MPQPRATWLEDLESFSNFPAHEAEHIDVHFDMAKTVAGLMQATDSPGSIQTISGPASPAPLSPAAAAIVLTLCDANTALYLAPSHDNDEVRSWIAVQTGAAFDGADVADFALGDWQSLQPIERFKIGSVASPQRSATLIIERPMLLQAGAVLTGPGIEDTANLNLPAVSPFQNNAKRYPLGFDCYFTAANQMAALPRSTSVHAVY